MLVARAELIGLNPTLARSICPKKVSNRRNNTASVTRPPPDNGDDSALPPTGRAGGTDCCADRVLFSGGETDPHLYNEDNGLMRRSLDFGVFGV